MAKVRVFVPTYKRNDLFTRAIKSLMAQTYTDWIAEIHNDCPDDAFPNEYIANLRDDRFILNIHTKNFGAVATFNIFFKNNCKEAFYCLLEDDNWWKPDFLKTMVEAMQKNLNAKVAFSNHYIWEEIKKNEWKIQNQLRYSENTELYSWISFFNTSHAYKYHFSNCSLFIRNNRTKNYEIPIQTRGDFMEHVRERTFDHPLLYVNKPLVNFALTLNTYRKKNIDGYHEHEALLIASFFKYCNNPEVYIEELLIELRKGFGNSINKFIYAGLIDNDCKPFLKHITLKEWILFLLYNAKHFSNTIKVFQAKKRYSELWEYLCENTKQRFLEKIFN